MKKYILLIAVVILPFMAMAQTTQKDVPYDIIGYYHITDDEFMKSSSFWKTMFSQHLLF